MFAIVLAARPAAYDSRVTTPLNGKIPPPLSNQPGGQKNPPSPRADSAEKTQAVLRLDRGRLENRLLPDNVGLDG